MADQRVELHVDLALAGGRHLVVVAFDDHADLLHHQRHLGAQVLQRVGRRHREVALLGAHLVAEVRALVLGHVPVALDRVDRVGAEVDVLAVAHVVEHEELGLGPEERLVADARARQVLLGLARHAARVAAVEVLGHRVMDVADHDQRLVAGERVEEGGLLVRQEQHVGGLDLLEAADRGAVEAQALVDRIGLEGGGREGGVLPDPGQVGEAQVDDLDAVVPDRLHDLGGRRASQHHGLISFRAWRRPRSRRAQRWGLRSGSARRAPANRAPAAAAVVPRGAGRVKAAPLTARRARARRCGCGPPPRARR